MGNVGVLLPIRPGGIEVKRTMIVAGLTACITAAAPAGVLVQVEITGEVEFAGGPLSPQMSPRDPVRVRVTIEPPPIEIGPIMIEEPAEPGPGDGAAS